MSGTSNPSPGGRALILGGGRNRQWRSRPLSRVLSWTIIPLGPASPLGSSSTPGDGPSQPIVPLFGLAPSGVYRALRRCPRRRWALTPPFHPYHAPLRAVRRSALCCTSRRLAPPRRYLALCSVEPGLSSARLPASRLSWPTPPRALSHDGGFSHRWLGEQRLEAGIRRGCHPSTVRRACFRSRTCLRCLSVSIR